MSSISISAASSTPGSYAGTEIHLESISSAIQAIRDSNERKVHPSPLQMQLESQQNRGQIRRGESPDWPEDWESVGSSLPRQFQSPIKGPHNEPEYVNSLQLRAIHLNHRMHTARQQIKKRAFYTLQKLKTFTADCNKRTIQPEEVFHQLQRTVERQIFADATSLESFEKLHKIRLAIGGAVHLLHRSRSGLVNLDSLRQSKIDSEASDRRGRGPSGQGEEKDRFDEVKPSPNSLNLTVSGIYRNQEKIGPLNGPYDGECDPRLVSLAEIFDRTTAFLHGKLDQNILDAWANQIIKEYKLTICIEDLTSNSSSIDMRKLTEKFRTSIKEYKEATQEIGALYNEEVCFVICNAAQSVYFALTQDRCEETFNTLIAICKKTLSKGMIERLRNDMQEINRPKCLCFFREFILNNLLYPHTFIKPLKNELHASEELSHARSKFHAEPSNAPPISNTKEFISYLQKNLDHYTLRVKTFPELSKQAISFVVYNTVKLVFFLLTQEKSPDECEAISHHLLNICQNKLSSERLHRLYNEMKARNVPQNFSSLEEIIINNIYDPSSLIKKALKQIKLDEQLTKHQPQFVLQRNKLITRLQKGLAQYQNELNLEGELYDETFSSTIYKMLQSILLFLPVNLQPSQREEFLAAITADCPGILMDATLSGLLDIS